MRRCECNHPSVSHGANACHASGQYLMIRDGVKRYLCGDCTLSTDSYVLSATARDVLAQLRFSEQSAAALAKLLDVPVASIRRVIQELRVAGYNVAFATGNGGPYRLME